MNHVYFDAVLGCLVTATGPAPDVSDAWATRPATEPRRRPEVSSHVGPGCDVCGFGSVENVGEHDPSKPCLGCGSWWTPPGTFPPRANQHEDFTFEDRLIALDHWDGTLPPPAVLRCTGLHVEHVGPNEERRGSCVLVAHHEPPCAFGPKAAVERSTLAAERIQTMTTRLAGPMGDFDHYPTDQQ